MAVVSLKMREYQKARDLFSRCLKVSGDYGRDNVEEASREDGGDGVE